jgi:hypothetical protein
VQRTEKEAFRLAAKQGVIIGIKMNLLKPNKQLDLLLSEFPVRVIETTHGRLLIRPQSELRMHYRHVIYISELNKSYVITELNDRAQYVLKNIF